MLNPKFDVKMFVERKKIRKRLQKECGFVLIPRPYEYYCTFDKTKIGKKTSNLVLTKNPYYEFEKEEFLEEFPEYKNKLDST